MVRTRSVGALIVARQTTPCVSQHQVRRHAAREFSSRSESASAVVATNSSLDSISRLCWTFMLPHSNDCPAGLNEFDVRGAVALYVGCELLAPPRRVRLRRGGVLRARVPEAPVHVNSNVSLTEDDVRPATAAGENRDVNAVPKTSLMELSPQEQFRLGVAPLRCLHASPDGRRNVGLLRATTRHGYPWRRSGTSRGAPSGAEVRRCRSSSPVASAWVRRRR